MVISGRQQKDLRSTRRGVHFVVVSSFRRPEKEVVITSGPKLHRSPVPKLQTVNSLARQKVILRASHAVDGLFPDGCGAAKGFPGESRSASLRMVIEPDRIESKMLAGSKCFRTPPSCGRANGGTEIHMKICPKFGLAIPLNPSCHEMVGGVGV